ncbi:MAG TPA: peptide-methionine (R)-S-oxide reductase MsrB [Puia sp.]|jgi:peptide-methionine (R)-S-oxide reductase|nr:peptide-methionine (R)-S-oxide reductase MsrB [Puia sp.]
MLNWNDVLNFANKGNPKPDRRVEKSDDEWKNILSPAQFRITRKKDTEAKFSGGLCSLYSPGKYNCICCNSELFDSGIKYDSKTGWPSFSQPIKENAIKYAKDNSFGTIRIEVLCNVCDAHLGHVFPDGPAPSGLRYCINSESIKHIEQNSQSIRV